MRIESVQSTSWGLATVRKARSKQESPTPYRGGTAQVQTTETDAVLRSQLNNRRTPTVDQAQRVGDEIDPALLDNKFGQALLGILGVARKAQAVAEKYNEFGVTGERQGALASELNAIKSEFGKILKSDDFRDVRDAVTGADDRLLQNKQGLLEQTRKQSSLLGDEYQRLVENEDRDNLKRISRNINLIANADFEKNLTNPEFGKALEAAVLDTFAALAGNATTGQLNPLANFVKPPEEVAVLFANESNNLLVKLIDGLKNSDRDKNMDALGEPRRNRSLDLLRDQ